MTGPSSSATSSPTGSPAGAARRGGPPAWFLAVAVGSLVLGAALVVLQLFGIGVRIAGPGATLPPTGQPAEITHALVAKAMQQDRFQVQDPLTPYRPPESAELKDVPRRVVQAILPEDPQGGYVVIYEFADADAADAAGRSFLRYLGSGTGAIQYPRDAQFVVRRVGQTLVFYWYSVEATPDAPVAELGAAIATVGSPIQP